MELLSAGNSGQQAFIKLAQSIAAAERPMIGINSKLKEFGTTLANTARWQISSSVLHGFMGAVSKAYNYAQDLNKSLNDIRIVTGQNAEQMTNFAVKANKAAKELSATTNEYAKASLIYYQQGLSDSEVEERTAVTIKMANVAGQSAEVVSEQMTAIWNNFDDGSKSLEHYADVMTALGAATATSTDEIAAGLEKFASIGETVGLSYEYAAAALATITSNTRESADTVGTALKTIFARMQGLKLGETLEDGVDLNKYSEALSKVGINVIEQNGELKKMDDILDEMGGKWDTLSNAQQMALAQTVAGVRQYTHFISLMNNWNSGDNDSMLANLTTANNSEGELQKQQEIFEESWEAARDRVQASMEGIYDELIDDDFFISMANGFSGLMDSLNAFIDGAGGLKAVLIGVGGVFLSMISTKITPALQQLGQNLELMFFGGEAASARMSKQMTETTNKILADKGIDLSDRDRYALEAANQTNAAKNKLLMIEKDLSPLEKQRYAPRPFFFPVASNKNSSSEVFKTRIISFLFFIS